MTITIGRGIVAAATALAIFGCGEQPYRHYAGTTEAIAAGERERGWLPAWLPASARDVHLQGDLDTNDWWLRARLWPAAADSLRRRLSPVVPESVRVRRPRAAKSWWFEGLAQQQPANGGALNAELFRGTGEPVPRTTVVAFDRTSPTVFVWTRGTR